LSVETALAPVAAQERIETLDILRGFALFCIFVVNWCVNSLWDTDRWEGFSTGADRIAYEAITFLLDEKSWPMFAFMFGLGFSIQMLRAEARGAPFVATYTRRLAVLFLIGAAHFILTERDILFQYALFGFLLLPLGKLKLNLLIVLAFVCVLIPFTRTALLVHDRLERSTASISARTEVTLDPAVLDTYVGEYELASGRTLFVTREGNRLFGQLNGWPPFRLFAESPTAFFMRSRDIQVSFVKDARGTVTGMVQQEAKETVTGTVVQRGRPVVDKNALRRAANKQPDARLYATGTFSEIVRFRARLFWEKVSSWSSYVSWLGDPFPPFLLGLYAGRRRIFQTVAMHRLFVRKVMWWGLVLGLAGTAAIHIWLNLHTSASVFSFVPAAVARLSERLGSPALGLAYLAALTLLLQRDAWKQRLAPLGAVGRMALTNYLLQSVAFVLLFFGYGLGWYGKVGAFGGLMLALAVFALQIVASRWWLRSFRFGPAEWLWRSATYWKWQPMRLQRAQLVAGVASAK